MNKEIQEYISLRQEVVDLCFAADKIIHILYLFLAPYLCFVLTQKDTIYILSIHIVIIPLYLLAIDRRLAACKIAAYLSVFHEEEGNKWQTRSMKYTTSKAPIIFKYFSAKHFPFIFANFLGLIIFIRQTIWEFPMPIYETIKIILEVILFLVITIIFMNYKKMQGYDYLEEWEKIKQDEDRENKEKHINFINNMPEEAKSTIFKIIIQQAKEEYKNTGKNPFKLK